MTLPASGEISLSQVNTELGVAATTQRGLGDTAVRTLFGIASGQIDLNSGHGKSSVAKGQIFWDGGSYSVVSWVVPAGVTSISAVCIGGGGGSSCMPTGGWQSGGGGGLSWINNIAVTPGETLTINVGAVGARAPAAGSNANPGGNSTIVRGATILLRAQGGQVCAYNNYNSYSPGGVGGAGGTWGSGGYGGAGGADSIGGGGGAGGYSGKGGSGYNYMNEAGVGGGGGGGGSTGGFNGGYGGGGTGMYGEGASGAFGGSAGGGAGSPGGTYPSSAGSGGYGGWYGGGAGAAGNGGGGLVRIIWGPGRAFPSTSTGDV